MAYDRFTATYGVPNDAFESVKNTFCDVSTSNMSLGSQVIVFPSALGQSRLTYGLLAGSVANRGYIVVTVDHPYDALIVEYPDGSTVRAANITTNTQISKALVARQHDVLYVINQRRSCDSIVESKDQPLDVLAAGHSLGGAAVAAVMMVDPTIIVGINLDEAFHEPFTEYRGATTAGQRQRDLGSPSS